MEIVQIQGVDDEESIVKTSPPLPPKQINIPQLKLEEDECHQNDKAEEEQENVEDEDRTVDIVQKVQDHGENEDLSVEDVQEEAEEECRTPRGKENRIPEPLVCPPTPVRRSAQPIKRTIHIPPDRFFPVPEDLNSVFITRKKIRSV